MALSRGVGMVSGAAEKDSSEDGGGRERGKEVRGELTLA